MIFKEDAVGGRTRVTMMKNVCCDKVEQKSSCRDIVVEILRLVNLVGCENVMCWRKEFIFNTFVYFELV